MLFFDTKRILGIQLTLYVTLGCLSLECFHEVVSIHSICEVQELIRVHAEGSLVLIDIDDTLLIAQDKVIRNANLAQWKRFIEHLEQQPNGAFLKNIMFQTAEYRLVEPAWLSFVENLKTIAHAVYGFTARKVGPFIIESSSEDWIKDQLAKLGINFTQHIIPLDYFRHGILFCGRRPKGEILSDFLSKQAMPIDTIIMIDDRSENIESVSQHIERFNHQNRCAMNFLGICYRAVELIDHTIDEKLIAQQFDILVKDKRYLSEKEIQLFY